jgi:hypothetical protein
MCDLMTAVGLASSVAGFAAESQATASYNANAKAMHRDASIAAGWKYLDESQRFAYDAKQAQQEGYDLAIQSRENIGSGISSAAASGVQGLSLGSLVSNNLQKTAENNARLDAKREDSVLAFNSNVKSYEAEARSAINSMPFRSGPSVLGLGIDLASTMVGSRSNPGPWG